MAKISDKISLKNRFTLTQLSVISTHGQPSPLFWPWMRQKHHGEGCAIGKLPPSPPWQPGSRDHMRTGHPALDGFLFRMLLFRPGPALLEDASHVQGRSFPVNWLWNMSIISGNALIWTDRTRLRGVSQSNQTDNEDEPSRASLLVKDGHPPH